MIVPFQELVNGDELVDVFGDEHETIEDYNRKPYATEVTLGMGEQVVEDPTHEHYHHVYDGDD